MRGCKNPTNLPPLKRTSTRFMSLPLEYPASIKSFSVRCHWVAAHYVLSVGLAAGGPVTARALRAPLRGHSRSGPRKPDRRSRRVSDYRHCERSALASASAAFQALSSTASSALVDLTREDAGGGIAGASVLIDAKTQAPQAPNNN
mgnify:CR=1 FL=1